MAQGSDQIKEHIDRERQRLDSNIREIEDRVRRSTDWHTAFEKNPWVLLGAAAAGGLILSRLIPGSKSPEWEAPPAAAAIPSRHVHQISETVDNIVGALIGLGTSKIKEFVGDAVPGFAEHYEELHRGQ